MKNKIGKLGLAGLYVIGNLAIGCAGNSVYQNKLNILEETAPRMLAEATLNYYYNCENMANGIRNDIEKKDIVILEDYAPRNLANLTICTQMKEDNCDIPKDLEPVCKK